MKESEHRLKIPPDDNHKSIQYTPRPVAEVVELVDTTDSKSVAFTGLRVRVPPSVPHLNQSMVRASDSLIDRWFLMRIASSDFLPQHDVKGMVCKKPEINYPIKLNRYWISGHLIRMEGSQNPNQSVVEIGIDRGQMKRWMNNLAWDEYSQWDGYDVEIKPLTSGLGYDALVESDVTEPSWSPTQEYDTAVLIHFLEHLHEPEAFVERLSPHLKPGSAIVGGMPVTPEFARHNREVKIRKTAKPFGHVSVFSPERIRDMAKQLRFSVEILTGAFFVRCSDNAIENSKHWLEFNYWFGKTFPSIGGEIYFKLRKL